MVYQELYELFGENISSEGIVFKKGPVYELFVVEEEGVKKFFVADIITRTVNEISETGLKMEFLPKDRMNPIFTGKPRSEEPEKEPKRRGRPPGSKNKPKEEKTTTKPKRRGRPPKNEQN